VVQQAARASLVLLLGALALSGCLGGSSAGGPAQAGARIGVPLNLANCKDWKDATPSEREGTIKALKGFAGGPTGGAGDRRGATLPDGKAYQLLENTCRNYYARGFKLYKLYTRGASLQNLPR
jgi:hypothetical protein